MEIFNINDWLGLSGKNVNITDSVGLGGKNLRDDVRKVQELLNMYMPMPLRLLDVNGICTSDTIEAIKEFQRRVLKIPRPDGKIDTQGMTMAALSPVALQRLPEVLVPFREGHGLYVKKSGSKSLFGTPKTIASLQKLARKVAGNLDANVGITDLSYEGGGRHPEHGSHRRGVDVDIRPLRKDKRNLGVTISDDAYSRELTKAMVGYLREDPNVLKIHFNDETIEGVSYAPNHHHHLHVRFKE